VLPFCSGSDLPLSPSDPLVAHSDHLLPEPGHRPPRNAGDDPRPDLLRRLWEQHGPELQRPQRQVPEVGTSIYSRGLKLQASRAAVLQLL
ncbi:hypothetical protein CCH79_00020612, partial [Gambusia affinis]